MLCTRNIFHYDRFRSLNCERERERERGTILIRELVSLISICQNAAVIVITINGSV
jgi:hypothetical protein